MYRWLTGLVAATLMVQVVSESAAQTPAPSASPPSTSTVPGTTPPVAPPPAPVVPSGKPPGPTERRADRARSRQGHVAPPQRRGRDSVYRQSRHRRRAGEIAVADLSERQSARR